MPEKAAPIVHLVGKDDALRQFARCTSCGRPMSEPMARGRSLEGERVMAVVDVVVPCYQYGRYLRACVSSVLSQDIQQLRVLIIDNASTDDSLEVARELAAEDSRVQVAAHETNLGHLASFNEGIDWASSDYFMVLCADDLLAPGCLSRAVSIMEQCPAVNLTFGRALWIHGDGVAPHVDPCVGDAKWRIVTGRELLKRVCRAGGRHGIEWAYCGGQNLRPEARRLLPPGPAPY